MTHSIQYSKQLRKTFLTFSSRSLGLNSHLSDDQIYWLLNLGMLLGWLIINTFNYFHNGWFETQLMASTLKKISFYMVPLLALKLSGHFLKSTQIFTSPIEIYIKLMIVFSLSAGIAPIVLTTPFPIQDPLFFKTDRLMHINVYHLMNTITHHPYWNNLLEFCYTNWVKVATFLLMYSAIQKKEFCHHMLRLIQIGIYLTSIIFFFLPSLGPLSIAPHFWLAHNPGCQLLHSCSETLNRSEYLNVQHHISIYIRNLFHSGFISFPSYHFYGGLLIVYYFVRQFKYGLPFAIVFTSLLGSATLFLGHHYLSDLIASILMLISVLFIEKKLMSARNNNQ